MKILTDHTSLKYLVTQLTLSHWQVHWLGKLAKFNYEIKYTPSPMNIVPDALSWHPDYNLATLSKSIPMTSQDFLNLVCAKISNDKDFGPVLVHPHDFPADDDAHSAYHIENGLLFLWEGEWMCIPDIPKARTILLQEVHDSMLAEHHGLDKMYTRLL